MRRFLMPASALSASRALVPAVAVVLLSLTGCGQSAPSPGAVQASGPTAGAQTAALMAKGADSYEGFVRAEARGLLEDTTAFAEAFAAGDGAKARSIYPRARLHWERIEPVAEQFKDLDPKLDAREASLEPGQEWTGWHRAEKDLFPPAGYAPMAEAERRALADRLVADTRELQARTESVELTAEQVGAGAKELLDEVARGKVTGEEEAFSHTDLWDFQGNVDGAKEAFESLRPAVAAVDPALAADLDARFAALQAGLSQHARGSGYVGYDELGKEQVQVLAALVDSLAEPLSRLTAAVTA